MTKKQTGQMSIDFDKCIKNIGNKFNLVLIASARAREIRRNSLNSKIPVKNITIEALKDIEKGLVDQSYLEKVTK